jgi:hypothetical protein
MAKNMAKGYREEAANMSEGYWLKAKERTLFLLFSPFAFCLLTFRPLPFAYCRL